MEGDAAARDAATGDVRGASRTHDRLRHDALHLGRHGDRLFDARRARGLRRTGAAWRLRGTPLLGSDDRARERRRACLWDGRGAVSHRAKDARRSTVRVRMNRARVALRPSPSTPGDTAGGQIAQPRPRSGPPTDRALSALFGASRPPPAAHFPRRVRPARRSRRPDATPHRVSSRTMGGSRNSGRAVGGGGLGSVRLPNPPRLANLVLLVSARAPPPTRR